MRLLRTPVVLILGLLCWAGSACAQAAPAEFSYTEADSVTIGAFEARKTQDLKTSLWHVELLRDGRTLFRSGNGAKAKEDLLFAAFPLLGGEERQLLVEEYTGDAFCCTYNYVLRVGVSLDVLYSSSQYPVGYGLVPIDLNGDGVWELVTTLTRFDNFFNLPHEESPSIRVVFQYDPEKRRYQMANREFSETVLDEIEAEKALVKELLEARAAGKPAIGAWRSKFTGAVLNVSLRYLYAGKQEEGWAYFQNTYDLDDRDVLLANLRYYLMRCPVFRSVYDDVREVLRTSLQTN